MGKLLWTFSSFCSDNHNIFNSYQQTVDPKNTMAEEISCISQYQTKEEKPEFPSKRMIVGVVLGKITRRKRNRYLVTLLGFHKLQINFFTSLILGENLSIKIISPQFIDILERNSIIILSIIMNLRKEGLRCSNFREE